MNDFEYAIKMEMDGQAYYLEQAEANKGNHLQVVFQTLAKDEGYHAQIIRDHFNGKEYNLTDNQTLNETKNVFANAEDYQNEVSDVPHQLDVYREAVKREKASIDLYDSFLNRATTEKEITLFAFLVKEEKRHFTVLDTLATMLNRPNDWTESAEFGIREEY